MLPVHPGVHQHLYPPKVLVQVAPFKQGELEQLIESGKARIYFDGMYWYFLNTEACLFVFCEESFFFQKKK